MYKYRGSTVEPSRSKAQSRLLSPLPSPTDCPAATPNGQLPIIEVDGTVIPQSSAQMRYVGKIGGLYPTDPIDAAFADAAMDSVTDIHIPMRASLQEKDDEKKVRAEERWVGNAAGEEVFFRINHRACLVRSLHRRTHPSGSIRGKIYLFDLLGGCMTSCTQELPQTSAVCPPRDMKVVLCFRPIATPPLCSSSVQFANGRECT